MKKNSPITFKSVRDLAYFTADATILKEFNNNKFFPDDWDYVISESDVEQIEQKNIRTQILKDIEYFNYIVVDMIQRRLDWFLAEGFTVKEDNGYRFLSDQEIEAEIDKILAE